MLTASTPSELPIRPSKAKAQISRKRTFNRKVRTGCKTCKIRRVKCDEARPICRRCQKADIICDGYDNDVAKQLQMQGMQDLAWAVDARYSTRPICPRTALGFPRSPSTPSHFGVPEQLFFNIERYMSVSFSNCTWVMVDGETCTNVMKGGDLEDLDNFYNYCSTGVELFRKRRFVEGRRLVSQACSLVRNIIMAENPQSVEYLLHVLLFLIRGDFPDIVFLLSKYISNMASVCLPAEHSWAQILRLMASLDPDYSEEIILQCWKCMNEMYRQGLGQRHVVSIESEVNMIRLSLTGPNLGLAEQRLRDIQVRCAKETGVGSKISFHVFNSLWRNLCAQGKYAEAEEAVWKVLGSDEELKYKQYYSLGRAYLARAQYEQGKRDLSKQNIIEAVKIIGTHLEPSDPWALRELLVLQSLWQEWGFEQEPVELGKEIELRVQHGKVDDDDL